MRYLIVVIAVIFTASALPAQDLNFIVREKPAPGVRGPQRLHRVNAKVGKILSCLKADEAALLAPMLADNCANDTRTYLGWLFGRVMRAVQDDPTKAEPFIQAIEPIVERHFPIPNK